MLDYSSRTVRQRLFGIFKDAVNVWESYVGSQYTGFDQRISAAFCVPEFPFSADHPDGYSEDYCFYVPMAEGAEIFAPQYGVGGKVIRPAITQTLEKDYRQKRSDPQYSRLLHLGTGGLMNLDMAASARADAIVLCDLNPQQLALWNRVIELIQKSQSREDLFEKLFTNAFSHAGGGLGLNPPVRVHLGNARADAEMLQDEDGVYRVKYDHAFFAYHFDEEQIKHYLRHSTLFNDKSAFRHVKNLADKGLIATAFIDLTNSRKCNGVRQTFEAEGYKIGSIFTANISYYFRQDSEPRTSAMRNARARRGEASDYFDRHPDKETAKREFDDAMRVMGRDPQTSVYNLIGDGVLDINTPGKTVNNLDATPRENLR